MKEVLSVVFSPDGKTLASGGADTTVWRWDTNTGLPKGRLIGHTEGVNSVAFSPDGTTLASGRSGQDGTIVGCRDG